MSFDGRTITAEFGSRQQHGEFTDFGAGELARVLGSLDLSELAQQPIRLGPDRLPLGKAYTVTLQIGPDERTYTWYEPPPSIFAELHTFLSERVLPLMGCDSTEAVRVDQPCTYTLVY